MLSTEFPAPTVVVEGANMGLATGLLMLLREAIEPLSSGSVIAVRTTDESAAHDLPAWCRVTAHRFLGTQEQVGDPTYFLIKGGAHTPGTSERPDWGVRLPLRQGNELHTRDWMVGRVGQVPEEARTTTGFAPRGAVVEPGAPEFDFSINSREDV